jgi:hypothetical protein
MTIVQPPASGLIGASNYNLYSACRDLRGVSVTVEVTEEMIAVPSAPSAAGTQSNGIAFQLNCVPPASSSATSWQQYIMVLSRTGQLLRWGINNWRNDASVDEQLINQGGDLAVVPSNFGAGYANIPAGYKFQIALSNNGPNIDGATFSAWNQDGAPLFAPQSIAMTDLEDVNGQPVTDSDLGPIADIALLIVGYANGADTVASAGAGTITYRAHDELQALNAYPGCTNGVSTAESSNVTYGELDSAASRKIIQSFAHAKVLFRDPVPIKIEP